MVQILPRNTTARDLSQNIGSQITQAIGEYSDARMKQKAAEELALLADPNTSSVVKANIISRRGDIKDIMKFNKEQSRQSLLDEYRNITNPEALDTARTGQPDAAAMSGLSQPPQEAMEAPWFMKPGVKSSIGHKFQVPPKQAPQISPEEREARTSKLIEDLGMIDPQTAGVLQRERAQKQKMDIAREKSLDKSREATKEYRTGVTDQFKSMKRNSAIVDRMIEIADDPESTSTPALVTLMQKFGVPAGVFGNPTDEELEKLSGELTKELPASWRGRILASEFNTLLRTIPSLLNTPEGRRAIIRNMKLLQEPARLEYEAMREIVNEYDSKGLKHPYNLDQLVLDRIEPKMDELYKEFVKGEEAQVNLAEKINPGSSKSNLEEEMKDLPKVGAGKSRYRSPEGKFYDLSDEEAESLLKKYPKLVKVQ